jgi:hypothetical protein
MKYALLISIVITSTSTLAADIQIKSIASSTKPEPVGNVIQRQVFADAPYERYILTQIRDVAPTGSQSCTNGNCNTRINTWDMSTAEPLYFLASSVKVICNEKLKRHCELMGGYQIGSITDRSITFTTIDKSPEIQGASGVANTYTLSAKLMIKEPRTKKGVFDPQYIYSSINFYINIPDSALETELIGYHKKYGPFLIDPMNFEAGYGITKIRTETYPGGKRVTFFVEDEVR